jgi:hypothetical protein
MRLKNNTQKQVLSNERLNSIFRQAVFSRPTLFFQNAKMLTLMFAFLLFSTIKVSGQAADAANAVQICDGIWPEPSATANTGSVVDLNATSKGCLNGGENGSNWYYAQVTTSGTMAFSVQGVKANGVMADIDGAVWGPFTSVASGATAIRTTALAPLRCSYAVGTGFELRVGNTQNSEGSTGDGLIAPIPVTAGQYYIIFVDNFNAANIARAVSIQWNFTSGNTAAYACPTMPTTCGPSCSTATCPVADRGVFAAKGVQPAGAFTFAQCNSYSAVPFKAGDGTFTQCYTVNSGANGNLGIVQQIAIFGTDANNDLIPDCTVAVAFSRTVNLTLASAPCGTAIPPSRTNAGNSSTFNPEWDNLTPNTSYIVCISTTMPAPTAGVICNYRQSCVDAYHYPVIISNATFAFNCGTATSTGTFTANGTAGQTGTLTIPLTGTTAGNATFNVTGTGFTGTFATTLTAGQASVSIPITYNGTGASGSQTLTVTSTGGTGTCTPSVTVLCPTIPTVTTTVTQPTCAVATGTITVTAPTSGYTYSFDNGATFQASASKSALAAGTYQVIAKGTTNACLSTATATTINAQPTAPSVTTAPTAVSTCSGNNAMFTVSASGNGLTYQWQQNTGAGFANIAGQTSAILTLSAVTASMSGYTYQCIVSGTCTPSVTTSPVSLTVAGAPAFTTQPANAATCIGNTATFTSAATGVGTTYQWERSTNGGTSYSVLSGQTAATYTTTAVTAAMNTYKYRVVATQAGCGTTTSNVATLSAEGVITISTPPSVQSTCAGGNATFTSVSATSTGGTLAYQWEVSTNAGGTYTALAGQTAASLTLNAVTAAMNGNLYRIKVTTGACTAGVTSAGVALNVEGPVTFTTPPANQSLCIGTPVVFSVSATVPNGTPLYQWQVQTVAGGAWSNIVGENASTLALGNATVGMNGYSYRVNVSSTGCASASSAPATLTVEGPIAITTQPLSTAVCAASNAVFTVAATTGSGTAAYQWEENTGGGWLTMAGQTNATLTLSAVPNTKNGYQYRVKVTTGACATAVVSSAATLTVHGVISITTQPINVVVVCSGSPATFTVAASNGVAGTLLYQWQVNSGSGWSNIAGANNATYTMPSVNLAQNNYQYRAQVTTSACGTPTTSNAATLSVNGGVAITNQPITQTVCDGQDATFSIVATATGSLTYQWQENNGSGFVDIAGETAAILSLIAVDNATTGYQYRVIVTGGGCGQTASTPATLTIEGPVTIVTQPLSIAACVGTSARFVVKATSPNGVILYQWYRSTDGGGSYLPIAGATDSAYLIPTALATMNGYRYKVGYRTGACVEQLSNAANLSIEGPISIATQPTSQTLCAGSNATFNISATVGIGTMTTQWQVKTVGGAWTNITGALLSNLNLGNATAAMNGNKYRVALSTPTCGTTYSDSATLSVNGPIVYSQQPSPTTVCGGQPVKFVSKATNSGSGGAITYQWQESSDNIAFANINNAGVYGGTTTDTLSISNSTGLNGKYYRLRAVAGVCNSVFSTSALLNTTGAAPTSFAGADATMCAIPSTSYSITTATSANGNISWTTTGTGTFSSLNIINPVYTPSAADLAAGNVTLILVTTGTAACSALAAQDALVLTFDAANVPNVNAGPDVTLCTNGLPINFAAQAVLPIGTNGNPTWTKLAGVTGVFNNANTLMPIFTPSAADIAAGNVTLTLTVLGTSGACTGIQRSDAIRISFSNNNVTGAVLTGGGALISGQSTNLNVAVTGGVAPYTVVYSNGSSNTTITNYTSGANIPVTPSVSTTYTLVSVSDATSCPSTAVSGSAVVTVNSAPDLTTTIGQPLTPLTVGIASNIPVVVKNLGGSPAPGIITTTLTIPAGTTAPAMFTSGTSTCATSGSTVTCTNLGPVASGDSIKVLVPVTPNATTIGTTPTFNATTTPVTGETSTVNNTAVPMTLAIPVAGIPDLTTTIGQPLTPLTVGLVSDIPVTIANIGSGPALGVLTTTLTLPVGVTAPPTFTTNGWTCATTGPSVSCTNPGPINAGRDSTFKVPVTPTAATVGTTPTFNATTTPVTGETITANNTTSMSPTTAVLGVPDLTTTIGQPAPQLTVGQTSNIPITIANIGTGPTPGIITTTVTLPAGVSVPANFTTNGWTCATTGPSVSCTNPGPIAAGANSVFNVPLTPNASIVGTQPVFNASTTPVSGEIVLGNNIATPLTAAVVLGSSTVSLSVKVFLSGAYSQAAGMMHDSLRSKGLIPTTQPFGASPYNTVASGLNYSGTETVAPSVFTTTGANAIVDWVLVELRSDTSTVVARRGGLVQRDGDVVDVDGVTPLTFTAASGSYYVVVKHRNHLGVMTASAIAMTATTTLVDFTLPTTANFKKYGAFGSNYAQRTYGSVRAMYGGNAGGNTTIIAKGASSDGDAVLIKVYLDGGNTSASQSYILYNRYAREDINLDGKIIYQGTSSELDVMLLTVFLHPINSLVVPTFVIYEQLP